MYYREDNEEKDCRKVFGKNSLKKSFALGCAACAIGLAIGLGISLVAGCLIFSSTCTKKQIETKGKW